MNNFLERLTKISFIALATMPLLRPNYNSMVIILCSLLTIYFFLKSKTKRKYQKKQFLFIIPFFMFLLHEIFSGSYNQKTILLQLPFLIFPLLFLFRPSFIDKKIKEISFYVFQISVIIQSLIYFFVFISNQSITQLFDISNENIPFFREYVTGNYLLEMHPTYFSSFLLISITISFFKFQAHKILNLANIVISTFFIVLFSSRIIILLLLLTIFSIILYTVLKKNKKKKYALAIGLLLIPFLMILFNSDVVKKRFNEVITEMNKSIVGNYYNSTNTRIAIYKCDFLLVKKLPFFGYGDKLQENLNTCYAENNDSNFYKISTFNTHNYYLNLLLYGGWAFILFFIIYLIMIYKNIKYSALALFIFAQFLFINLTENYLSRHYGIVLFSYFTALFIFFKDKEINARVKHI